MVRNLLFLGSLLAAGFAGLLLAQCLFDSWGSYLQRVWLRTRVLPQESLHQDSLSQDPLSRGSQRRFEGTGAQASKKAETKKMTQLGHLRETTRVLMQDCLRHGVPWLDFIAKRLCSFEPLAKGLHAYCQLSKYPVEPQALCEVVLAALIFGTFLSLLLFGSPFLGILLVLCGCAWAYVQRARQEQKRQELLQQQLPDALDSLGACFNVGFSIPQAFESTAQEICDPLGSELKTVVFDIDAGRSIQEALTGLEQRSSIKEMRFVAAALEIKNRTGGSFKSILEGASQSISDALELKRSLAVQTAQARLSARIVTLMPLGLLLLVTLADRDYLTVFFTSFAGFSLLCIAALLEVVGILIIRRILNIGGD